MLPPSDGLRSTSTTWCPALARSRAARRPATPPPMTSARSVTGTSMGSRGRACCIRTAIDATTWHALRVASSGSGWTHEHCSRMLAMSHRKGLSPAWAAAAVRNVRSWSCGEQAATTTRSSWWSLTASMTSFWPGAEQRYGYSPAKATPGTSRARSTTSRRTYRAGDVLAAVADEHPDSGHSSETPRGISSCHPGSGPGEFLSHTMFSTTLGRRQTVKRKSSPRSIASRAFETTEAGRGR